jgi:hypothetical protein
VKSFIKSRLYLAQLRSAVVIGNMENTGAGATTLASKKAFHTAF